MRTAEATMTPSIPSRATSRNRLGVWLLAVGMAAAGVSLLGLATVAQPETGSPGDGNTLNSPSPGRPSSEGAGTPTPALAVTAQRSTYEPGQSSGWHSHPGIHTVVVLSGTLTVVAEGCTTRTFGPGETYIGGQHDHVAVNQGTDPVEMMVVYSTTGNQPEEYSLPALAPDGCPTP